MVASFESALSRTANKRTDSRLLSLSDSPSRERASPNYISTENSWYRMDWGTGGNKFPADLSLRDPGVPWSHPRASTTAYDARPQPHPSPPYLFHGMGEPMEIHSNIIGKSLAPSAWNSQDLSHTWARELLPRPFVPTLVKSSRAYTSDEKRAPVWDTAAFKREAFKPDKARLDICPCVAQRPRARTHAH